MQSDLRDRARFGAEIRHDRYRADAPPTGSWPASAARTSCSCSSRATGSSRSRDPPSRRGSTPSSTPGPDSSPPPASRPEAGGSPPRPSAAEAGWRTRRCSRAPGSTAQGATTSSSRATASRSRRRSGAPAGGRSPTCRRTPEPGRRGRRSTATTRSTTAGTSGIAARSTRSPRCPTSTSCSPCSGSSWRSRTVARSSPRSTSCRATRRGRASRRLIDWSRVGDGSIFNRLPVDEAGLTDTQQGYAPVDQVHASRAVLVRRALRPQEPRARRARRPPALESRQRVRPGHDVPISIIAHDPAVIGRIAGWGWVDGMRPDPGGAGLADERLPEPLPRRVRLLTPRHGRPAAASRRQREVERVLAAARLRLQVTDVRGGDVHAGPHLRDNGHAAGAELPGLVRVVAEERRPATRRARAASARRPRSCARPRRGPARGSPRRCRPRCPAARTPRASSRARCRGLPAAGRAGSRRRRRCARRPRAAAARSRSAGSRTRRR